MNLELDREIQKQLLFRDPLRVLDQWLKEATVYQLASHKNSWPMFLSTAYRGKVSSRVVLLKEHKKGYLFFYTNYKSLKAQQIAKNPRACVNLYWEKLSRQLRIEGLLQKTSRSQSLSYWKSRTRESQISQWISQQSQTLKSKKQLLELRDQAKKQFLNKAVPCPPHWGGYKLKILQIEFWLEGKHRLHDRFLFKKQPQKSQQSHKGWQVQRLSP